ncbi:MAG: hypothetical protein NTX22_07605 [Ignavibacteriales bacterium]|nr:hypothetical protein [Ignavibacteriales bacterium]
MKKKYLIFSAITFVFLFNQIVANNYSGSKTTAVYVQPNNGNSYYAWGLYMN